MQTILCYGDSITWGFNPADGTRLPFDQRWPGILQLELGNSIRVVEESLMGRTTNWDSPFFPDRNGQKMLGALLESHSPIDIFILMLGTNDLWKSFNFTSSDIVAGCLSLIWTVQRSNCGPRLGVPEILLISPPPLGKLSKFMGVFFEGRQGVSKELGKSYEEAAKFSGCHFLDSSKYVKVSKVDGVHLEAPEHTKLAKAVIKLVSSIMKIDKK